MTTIWKSVLRLADFQEIKVPQGAEFISAREQRGEICVWFKCDPDAPPELRGIGVFPTGGDAPPIGNAWRFLGTASLADGNLIFHVFERLA